MIIGKARKKDNSVEQEEEERRNEKKKRNKEGTASNPYLTAHSGMSDLAPPVERCSKLIGAVIRLDVSPKNGGCTIRYIFL